jgi:hypothetical protein
MGSDRGKFHGGLGLRLNRVLELSGAGLVVLSSARELPKTRHGPSGASDPGG